MEKQNHARSLYMNEGKTQKEIAEIVGVSERTIYNWIRQFAWDKLRQAAFHAPAIIADNIFSQVVELQTSIAEREPGNRFPTLQEAETTRKLLVCLDKIKNATSLAQNMQMLETFRRFVYTKNEKVAGSIGLFEEQYLEANAVRGFKPYEMAYHPYTMSPFEYYENQTPREEQNAPVQNNIVSSKPAEDTTVMVNSDGSLEMKPEIGDTSDNSFDLTLSFGEGRGEASALQEPEIEIISEPEKATPAPVETIDSKEDNVTGTTETDRKKPEISSNLDVTVSRVEPRHAGEFDTTREEDATSPLSDQGLAKEGATCPAPIEAEPETDMDSSEVPISISSAYFITLPPHRRPSPFREGNTIWINHPDDLENYQQYIKMSDTIRRYDELK